MLDDDEVRRFTRLPVPMPDDFPEQWLERYEEGRRDGTREIFAIVDADEGRFLGVALAANIDRDAATVELGYVVDRRARGRGVAREALAALTQWAFDELHVERIELMISAENEPSKRVAARCGYVYEGTLRSNHLKAGIREDAELWSKLPSDP
jgi:RimJ/RimL family protein N-acetyltransferase